MVRPRVAGEHCSAVGPPRVRWVVRAHTVRAVQSGAVAAAHCPSVRRRPVPGATQPHTTRTQDSRAQYENIVLIREHSTESISAGAGRITVRLERQVRPCLIVSEQGETDCAGSANKGQRSDLHRRLNSLSHSALSSALSQDCVRAPPASGFFSLTQLGHHLFNSPDPFDQRLDLVEAFPTGSTTWRVFRRQRPCPFPLCQVGA